MRQRLLYGKDRPYEEGTMKVPAALCLLTLAACAHGGDPSGQSVGWDSLYGTYEFEGTLRGDQGRSTAVSGTLRLAEGRYFLTGNLGSCEGLLAPTVRTDLGWGCKDGLGIGVRRIGKDLATDGTASVGELKIVDHEVCTRDAEGNLVCTYRTEKTRVIHRGRITVRRVSGQERPTLRRWAADGL